MRTILGLALIVVLLMLAQQTRAQNITCGGISSDSSEVCSSNGTCVSQDTCVCSQGYTGSLCETAIPVCYGHYADDPLACSSNGMCLANNVCSCQTGWTGQACNVTIVCDNSTATVSLTKASSSSTTQVTSTVDGEALRLNITVPEDLVSSVSIDEIIAIVACVRPDSGPLVCNVTDQRTAVLYIDGNITTGEETRRWVVSNLQESSTHATMKIVPSVLRKSLGVPATRYILFVTYSLSSNCSGESEIFTQSIPFEMTCGSFSYYEPRFGTEGGCRFYAMAGTFGDMAKSGLFISFMVLSVLFLIGFSNLLIAWCQGVPIFSLLQGTNTVPTGQPMNSSNEPYGVYAAGGDYNASHGEMMYRKTAGSYNYGYVE